MNCNPDLDSGMIVSLNTQADNKEHCESRLYTEQVHLAEEIIKVIHKITLKFSLIISKCEVYTQLFTIR
jgi:hypothetical protein